VLEITETSLLEDQRAIDRLRALKRLGLRLAVDDFGTGYASLHYLQLFPLDALKIPKTFIDRLDSGTESSALVQATIDLGRTFQLDVIAEGIESPAQLARLSRLGCVSGQGFLLARPLSAQRIDALMVDPATSLTPSLSSDALPAAGILTLAGAAGAIVPLPSVIPLRASRRPA
jgi:EAL domain-containing protein (putative c-di-GMP-specific phosphodiesterase class I)